jgi:hypothetical protein
MRVHTLLELVQQCFADDGHPGFSKSSGLLVYGNCNSVETGSAYLLAPFDPLKSSKGKRRRTRLGVLLPTEPAPFLAVQHRRRAGFDHLCGGAHRRSRIGWRYLTDN